MEGSMVEVARQFITEEVLILIPVLWILGAILKRTKQLPDWAIVYVLPVVSIVVAYFILGDVVQAFIQGILVAGVAVFGHQVVKQTKKKI